MKNRLLLAVSIVALVIAAGCPSGKDKQPKAYPTEYIDKPTMIIKTTQGDIRVVLLASAEEETFRDRFFTFFTMSAPQGYYNGPIHPDFGRARMYEMVVFYRAESIKTETSIETQKFLNIEPVAGTLYYENKQTPIYAEENPTMSPLPRAIVSNFQIVTRTSQDIGRYKDIYLPSAGTTYCVGQVVEGMDVLKKLTARLDDPSRRSAVDKVTAIVQGPPYKILASKYADLCNGKITKFDEVLETKK